MNRTACVAPRQRQPMGLARGWSLEASAVSATRAVVRAQGEFDIAALDDVHRVLAEAAGVLESPAVLVVDLSGVTFLDAAMLGALVSERGAMLARGGDLLLTGVGRLAMRIIEICGLRETLAL